MNAGADELRTLDDAELRATVEHLERTVHELREARGECGLWIRLVYVEQLTADRKAANVSASTPRGQKLFEARAKVPYAQERFRASKVSVNFPNRGVFLR